MMRRWRIFQKPKAWIIWETYALRHGKLKAKKIGKLVYNIEPVDVLEWLIPAETFEILEKVYPGRDELKKDLLAVFKQWSE